MQHLAGLNEKQKEAVLHKEGPLLVLAGAGAGKTKTITHRIVNLVKEGVPPEKILAVTFTNKAAKEMRERVIKTMQENFSLSGSFAGRRPENERLASSPERDPEKGKFSVPLVSTFHSLGVQIIKENARALGLTQHFSILDEDDAKSIIREIIKDLGYDPKQYSPGAIKSAISREKGAFVSLQDFREKIRSSFQELVHKVWHVYEERKNKENSLDFDDLLLKTAQLLKENAEILESYQSRWQYVHIDEYQDTNEVQYLMSKMLSAKHKNICVVGDADQNIYSWRGANLKNILGFEKDYPDAKIILLEENYRSTKNILEAANEVIKKNKFRPEKNLFTQKDTGEKIGLYEALDEKDEATFVATKILEIADNKKSFSDIAVLYRTNFQSRILEEAMLSYNIPYQVLGTRFFDRKEIKDTLSYLRASLNKESLSDIKRIINFPARGIGKATLAKIFAGETETLPIKTRVKINNFYSLLGEIETKIQTLKTSEVIKFVVKKSGIEEELLNSGDEGKERLENIKELATIALKYENLDGTLGVEKLIEDASLASDQDSLLTEEETRERKEKESRSVKLMTVHASKGLEFNFVFVVGLEEGLFPNQRGGEVKNAEDSEEERRLFYVAITRAKEKLFLSFANFRTIFGSRQINAPSSFISDIPQDLLEREGEASGIKTIYL